VGWGLKKSVRDDLVIGWGIPGTNADFKIKTAIILLVNAKVQHRVPTLNEKQERKRRSEAQKDRTQLTITSPQNIIITAQNPEKNFQTDRSSLKARNT